MFEDLKQSCFDLRLTVESMQLPKHKAIDIQSSDAGPGVSSHERMNQIRLAELFQINNFYLQVRIHYAPNDSATHITEKVMRSLNEHVSDGIAIDIPQFSLADEEERGTLLSLTLSELESLKDRRNELAAYHRAKNVESKYRGKPCMGTSILSRVPEKECLMDSFFFDEKYMDIVIMH